MVYSKVSGVDSCACSDGYTLVESAWLNHQQCLPSKQLQVVSSKVDLSASAILKFSSFLSSETGSSSVVVSVTSSLYQDLFVVAATKCYFYEGDRSSRYCQALGNLCVLQHFDPSVPSCAFFDLIRRSGRSTVANSITGWYYTLPFLSYASPSQSVEQDSSIEMQVSLPTGLLHSLKVQCVSSLTSQCLKDVV
jgi:hypothetical protein